MAEGGKQGKRAANERSDGQVEGMTSTSQMKEGRGSGNGEADGVEVCLFHAKGKVDELKA